MWDVAKCAVILAQMQNYNNTFFLNSSNKPSTVALFMGARSPTRYKLEFWYVALPQK